MAAYEVLLLNTTIPQIQAAQSGDTYVVPRNIAFSAAALLANGANSAPSLAFSSDTDTGIFRPGTNSLAFAVGAIQAMTLDASGYLVVGDTNTNARFKAALTGASTASITTVSDFGAAGVLSLGGITNNNQGVYLGTGDARTGLNSGIAAGIGFLREASGWNSALAFYTNGTTDGITTNRITERARITSGGDFLVGTQTSHGRLTVQTDSTNGVVGFIRNTDNAFASALDFIKSRGSTASPTAVQDGDGLLQIRVAPYQGSSYTYLNAMAVQVDGTFTSGQNPPTRILWYTNAANGSATERMQITSAGDVNIGNGGTGTRTLKIQTNTSGDPTLNLTAAGVDLGSFWFERSTSRLYARSSNTGGVYLAAGGTSWTAVSDERKKDIIEPITDAAGKVSTLRAVIGKYKTDEDGKRRSFLIAQDVQAVFPEAVDATNSDELGLSYSDMIPLLVGAIKEQQAMINELKAKVASLGA